MATPNDSSVFSDNVVLTLLPDNSVELSSSLIKLLKNARQEYSWPFYQSPRDSQIAIIELEDKVNNFLKELRPSNAKIILTEVSEWGGNNKKAQTDIESASGPRINKMKEATSNLNSQSTLLEAFNQLNNIPGIRFVMATKIYRFCQPNVGAAVDRHTSYFFNSLDMILPNNRINKVTHFKREWSTGKHTTSRLAIYQDKYYVYNRNEYIKNYMPMLTKISNALNSEGITYKCAATGETKLWRPVDVEMAAFYWWAKNGEK